MVDLDLVLAIIPKFGSCLSIFSSSFIISEAIADHRKGKGTAIQRALVGMSAVDVCASFAWFLSTWPLPVGTAPLAHGNTASCNFQGFLLQLAVGAPLYNCSLALYYLLVIKFNWTNAKLAKIEKYVHGFIIAFSVGTSIAGLPLTMYNEVKTVCWVIGSPADCGNSSASPSDIPCERGDWAWLFGIVLFYGPLWVCVLLTVIAMVLIYVKVSVTFKRNERYRFQGRRPSVMNANRTSVTASGVRTDSAVTISERPPQRTNSGGSLGPASTITATGEICTRMSRFSAFSSKTTPAAMKELEELQAKLEREEELQEHDEEGDDQAEDGEHTEGADDEEGEDRIRLGRPTRNVAESEQSGGIGLKTAWINATSANELADGGHTKRSAQEATRRVGLHKRTNSTMSSRARRKQNMFAVQAILYSGSFIITWAPSTIWSVAYWFGVGGIGFDLAAACCEPLQGFWNMLIFIRSRPSSQEKLQRIFGRFCCFWMALLPQITESSQHSSSKHLESTHSEAEARRLSLSRANATNNSVEGMTSDVLSEREQVGEIEKSVHFDTEPSVGDSGSG